MILAGALALATAALWIWAGSEGSLATALRWAGAQLPLSSQQVTGTLRAGGTAGQLVWQQGGLRVQVDQAELRWTPAALLRRTLRIDRLSAQRILIDDQQPAGAPSTAPPPSLALPLHIRIDALQVAELAWAGPPPRALHDVAARYTYDGTQHRLDLDHARFDNGVYRARASLGAHAPIALDLALAGTLTTDVPGAPSPAALTLQASARGLLSELQLQAQVQAAPDSSAAVLPDLPTAASMPAAPSNPATPQAQLSARLTPWAAQPLPEAHAQLQALDLGAFWPPAPRTRLSGRLDLVPATEAAASDGAGWALSADLQNADAGPWDRHRLPVEALQADGVWQNQTATVRRFQAQLAGGSLHASGHWDSAARAPWRIDARATGIDPARLHSQLAALPLDGTASAQGTGTDSHAAIDFNTTLTARAPAKSSASSPTAKAQAQDLRALRLHSASARGRWAGGWLTLQQLALRTDDAQLAGRARLQLADASQIGGSADLTVSAPGLKGTVQGEWHPSRGAGTAQIELNNAARALAWAQTLPGAAPVLAGAQASGSATLQARWAGGWRDPELHARLSAPNLSWQPPGTAGDAPVQAHDVDLKLDGRLAQAQLSARARLSQGPRQLDLKLGADGGRTPSKNTLAASSWHAQVTQLQAQLRDPALGASAWQLASARAFTVDASSQAGGTLKLSAGELSLRSPAPSTQARLTWGPLHWQGGELSSTGRLSGLPLQWVQHVAGPALANAGIEGNVLFDGSWDLHLGRTLQLRAELARSAGDLTLVARDTETDVATRIPAGLRQARLQLASDGPAVTAELTWDSAEAGTVSAQLRTELAATRSDSGGTHWAWPESAPLTGQLQARLPQISAWSVLAPPGWRLRGALAANVRVAGTRGQPQLQGNLSADGLALRSVVDGFQLGRGQLRARLDGTRLVIDQLLLRGPGEGDAGGTLSATGEAAWADGRAQARLALTLARLHASVRADRDLTVSGQVQAALDGRQVSVSGGLRADRARFELPDDSAPSLGSDVVVHGARAATATAPAAASTPAPSPLTVDVKVQLDLGDELRVRGLGLDTRLAGRLQLSAQGPIGASPRLTGTIRTEGGSFHAYSQNLSITRGAITFTGALANPQLDILALRPNFGSEQKVGVQVAGSALLPRVRIYSDPQLADNQALAWLLLGRPAPATGAEAALLQSTALALLGGREGRGLAARFGLDELSFSRGADNGNNGAVGSASVTLGKRLSERLYAAYEHGLAGTSGSLLIFYELSRRWSLRAQAGENAALDLIYRLSFD